MKINFRIWTLIVIICALAIFSLNWVLRLPALVTIIGDENTWLPIIADIIVAIGLAYAGYKRQSIYDQKRRRLEEYEKNYDKLCTTLDDIHKSLSLERIFYSFILELDEEKDVRGLYGNIANTLKNIEDALYKFETLQSSVNNIPIYKICSNAIVETANAYSVVLNGLLETINKWNGLQNKLSRDNAIPQMLPIEDVYRIIKFKDECKDYLIKQRKKFINIYESQKTNMAAMKNKVADAITELKNAEKRYIVDYKKKNKL